MSRGVGRHQRQILDAATEPMTIAELSAATGRSETQVRSAVAALKRRKLVATRRTRIRWDLAAGYRRTLHYDDGKFYRAVPGLEVVAVDALTAYAKDLRDRVKVPLSLAEIKATLDW
ncbi:hypothetical protein [Mycobacterium sp. OTB74]|jgi:hypothetical protein|uniref:hypothetical protein n=1 Tax=Mycobacterium sp. OTB74 TaxID=1853452 RepID=UPI0024738D34|nr:hypothetical protein [Mycobacterium sp. OTB74]MDH6245036.1 transcription initiation factor IIE alpha subunit [Mycobacterium sp. OTB74]